jgi:hypothetical protein
MLGRALVALVLCSSVARADATACAASLSAARAWAARLDSTLEKLQVRVDGKRVVVSGAECGRVEVEVRNDGRARADQPWRPEKRRVTLLAPPDESTCGARKVEERAHGGWFASLASRAVPVAIVDRFKRAVDECVSGGARPKSAPRPARTAARP